MQLWSRLIAIHSLKTTSSDGYLRFHIKHVFNRHAFSVLVPLVDQLVFGPGHVDTIWRGGCRLVSQCRMRGCVAVVDQLGLTEDRSESLFFSVLISWRWPFWTPRCLNVRLNQQSLLSVESEGNNGCYQTNNESTCRLEKDADTHAHVFLQSQMNILVTSLSWKRAEWFTLESTHWRFCLPLVAALGVFIKKSEAESPSSTSAGSTKLKLLQVSWVDYDGDKRMVW